MPWWGLQLAVSAPETCRKNEREADSACHGALVVAQEGRPYVK